MSRGFGRVQRKLEKIFQQIGKRTYSITDLCKLVFDEPYKRHRVAVLRAVNSVAKRYPWIGEFGGGNYYTYYFCDCRNRAFCQARDQRSEHH